MAIRAALIGTRQLRHWFGNEIGNPPFLYPPGMLGVGIRQLAAGLGIEVDEIRGSVEQKPEPEDFEAAVGTITKGAVAAAVPDRGPVDGDPVTVVEHIAWLRGELRHDGAQPVQEGESYRVEIIGELP